MMNAQFIPYSDPQNLVAIRTLSQEIITDVEPSEKASLEDMLEDMVENYEQGYISAAETDSKNSGGFGEIDLITLVVVPLVVAVLEKLIDAGFEKWKEAQKAKKDQAEIQRLSQRIEQVVEEEYIIIERQVNSKKARRKEKIIKQTTVRVIRRYLLPEA